MVVGPLFRLGELRGLHALKTDGKYLKGFDSAYLAFAGLGMGDGAAVAIAEESHRGVLSEAGALVPSEEYFGVHRGGYDRRSRWLSAGTPQR